MVRLDIEYNITQSDSQRAIGSIETFMDTTFRSCSIFIDGTSVSDHIAELEKNHNDAINGGTYG